jgi:hypothetical protein
VNLGNPHETSMVELATICVLDVAGWLGAEGAAGARAMATGENFRGRQP